MKVEAKLQFTDPDAGMPVQYQFAKMLIAAIAAFSASKLAKKGFDIGLGLYLSKQALDPEG